MIKQKPFYPFLIVKKIDAPKKTASGIAVNPDDKQQEINYGEVVKLPEDYKDHRVLKQLKPGMRIQWKEYTGAKIFGEVNLFVVDAEELLYGIEE